ncbi:hypothetical protein [Nocardia sp. NPDC003963]
MPGAEILVLDFADSARRAARSRPVLSVIVEGGARDDAAYGAGFAHIREHWTMASFQRSLGAALTMSTAKTLQFQTEFLLFLDSDRAALPDILERAPWTDRELAAETAVIVDEIVMAESQHTAVAVDRELPRRLSAYGTGTDWGYGDRETIRGWTMATLTDAVASTWGESPRMHISSSGDPAMWCPGNPPGPARTGGGSLTVGSAPTPGPAPFLDRTAFAGWRIHYTDPLDLADLDDLAILLRTTACRDPRRHREPWRAELRIGQFGEMFTSRGDEYLLIATRFERPAAPADHRDRVRELLTAVRERLDRAVRDGDHELLAAVDRFRRLHHARAAQSVNQRTVLHNRAKALGLGGHPHLSFRARTTAENEALCVRLSAIIASLLTVDPVRLAADGGSS